MYEFINETIRKETSETLTTLLSSSKSHSGEGCFSVAGVPCDGEPCGSSGITEKRLRPRNGDAGA